MAIDYPLDQKPAPEWIKAQQKKILEMAGEEYEIASAAKAKGYDIETFVESPPGSSVGLRTENIVGPPGVAKVYESHLKETDGDVFNAVIKVIEDIIQGKVGDIETKEKRLEQALKTALSIWTQGTVVAPIEGLVEVKISKNFDGTEYADLYLSLIHI